MTLDTLKNAHKPHAHICFIVIQMHVMFYTRRQHETSKPQPLFYAFWILGQISGVPPLLPPPGEHTYRSSRGTLF